MSEPTGGEPNPFAEIIDLFREVEAAVPPVPPVPPVPLGVEPPRGGTPITPKGPAPAPSRRHRAVLLLPVALLALAGGAAAAVIHQRTGSGATTGPAVAPARPSSAPSMTPRTSPAAPAPAPWTAAYSAALDALAAAHGTDGLIAAAEPLTSTIKQLRRANSHLARAEAAHLDSLVRLSALNRLADFPSLVSAATTTSAQVEKAAAGRPDVPDPTRATNNVVATISDAVVTRIDGRVARLASTAAQAKLTAQLRNVAARANALAPTATRIAGRIATTLEGERATQATADATALHALGSLSVIDGDHLDAWTGLSAPLRQALAAAGVSAASADMNAIDTMIAGARQTLLAWAAVNQAAVNQAASGTSTDSGISKDSATSSSKTATKQAEAAIDSYVSSASALIDRYTRTIGGLPVVGPGQAPSAALTRRFIDNAGALAALSNAVGQLDPPAGMGRAQQALTGLIAKAHAAATAGQAVASSAENCDSATHSCAYGTQRRWADYAYAVGALADPSSVRATLTSAAGTAKKAAAASTAAGSSAAAPSTPAAATEPQPKPVV